MLESTLNTNHTASAPVEILDAIFERLPFYSLTGLHSVRTVCHQWNNIISARHRKISNKKLVGSIQTEEEALLFFDNTGICDEMSFNWLIRLAFKIPHVRDMVIPRLTPYELHNIAKYEIAIAKHLLTFHATSFNVETKLAVISCHEPLCQEYLDQYELTPSEAAKISKFQINIARRILKMPETNTYSIFQRYEIIKWHTPLVEENLEACAVVLDKEVDEQFSFHLKLGELIRGHRHSRVVVDYLMDRYGEIFIKFPALLADIAVCHLDIAEQLFEQTNVVNRLNFDLLLEMVGANFEIAKKVIANPEVVLCRNYNFTVFHILLKHFQHVKCSLFDEPFDMAEGFYKEYGLVLALSRVKQSLLNPKATAYDFKVSLAHDLFENPELIFHGDIMHFLTDIIDDLENADLEAMQPAIVKLFKNEYQRDRLDILLALKLVAKMPFLLDEATLGERYFIEIYIMSDSVISLELAKYRSSYLYDNPLLARKVMNYPNVGNLLLDMQRISMESNLRTREMIKHSLQSSKPSSRNTV